LVLKLQVTPEEHQVLNSIDNPASMFDAITYLFGELLARVISLANDIQIEVCPVIHERLQVL
jgi:hypothetical protein